MANAVPVNFMSTAHQNRFAFWTNLLRALETEPRKADFVRGVSGLEHPVIAVGVDDARRRLLLVSGEHDARSAAIAQLDIQRAIEAVQVVIMRPIAANLSQIARQIVDFLGGPDVAQEQLQERLKALPPQEKMQELVGANFSRYTSGVRRRNSQLGCSDNADCAAACDDRSGGQGNRRRASEGAPSASEG